MVISRADLLSAGYDSVLAYFVHSYHMVVNDPAQRLAHVDYAGDITAVVGRDTMLGMQFHPESIMTKDGKQMLRNFFEEAKERVKDNKMIA